MTTYEIRGNALISDHEGHESLVYNRDTGEWIRDIRHDGSSTTFNSRADAEAHLPDAQQAAGGEWPLSEVRIVEYEIEEED